MFRKLIPLLVVAVALGATGIALSAGGSGERFSLGTLNHTFGGGSFEGCSTSDPGFCLPNERRFAVDVHGEGRTSGALGTWEYGPPGIWHITGDITCARVIGGVTLIGGWVTESTRPELLGLAFATWVRDNGQVSSTPDAASIGWFGTPGSPTDFEATFPRVCRADGTVQNAYPVWFDVAGGVVVAP